MTIAEMHREFKLGLDKVDSLSHPNFLPEEIDTILNVAQDKFVKQRAYANNFRRLGLEETQKRLDDIRNLINNFTNNSLINTTDNKPGGFFTVLPSDYMFAIEEEALLQYEDCNGNTATKRIDVLPITHDRYNKMKRDPFNKPSNFEVHRLGYSKISGQDSFELITDAANTVLQYFLRYIKYPIQMMYGTAYEVPTTDVDSELAEHTHREIIAIAVKDALEDIESPRYPTSKNELNEIE